MSSSTSMSPARHLDSLLSVAEKVISLARERGASDADVIAARGTEFEVKVADGEILTLTQATSKGLGLRVFVDGRVGLCNTSDFGADALVHAVERGVALAREAAVDPHNGLADAEAGRIDAGDDLDLFDPAVPALPADDKIRWAHELEKAARAVDPRVKKFRDSGVSSGESYYVLVTSRGVVRTMCSTGISLWSTPLAEQDGELQTEFWYDSKSHVEDLEAVESIGRKAGARAVRMLGAKPVKTQRVPVIFEPPMAAGLVASVIGAIDGDMVYKKATFLADKLGASIAAPTLSVVDDPLLRRGAGSSPFDGEGLRTYKKRIIDKGKLTTFLYDAYTARKAGKKPTASGRRGVGGLPSAGPFNFYVEAGSADPAEILRSTKRGLIVTRGLGRGLNTVSGEYSRGANGLWVEDGEIVHPVQEVTIAGDYIAMLQGIDRLGSDLMMRGSTGAPTLRIAELAVSGR